MLPSLDRLTIDGHGALLPATTPDPEQERAAHYAFWLLKRDGFSRELINGSGVNSYVCEFAVSVDGHASVQLSSGSRPFAWITTVET